MSYCTPKTLHRGTLDALDLGNLTSVRDWGWAPDYVDAMAAMAEYGKGDDFVVATGQAHSVEDFVAAAFAAVGIENWRDYVRTDSKMLRPVDSARMVGDATKARDLLDWAPTKNFEQIVQAMVEFDMTEEMAA